MGIQAGPNLEGVDTVAQAKLGDEYTAGGNSYTYCQAGEALAAYQLVLLSATFSAIECATGDVVGPAMAGVTQFAVASGEYFWLPRKFNKKLDGSAFYVNGAASCATNVKLYTTATPGVVDDTATTLVNGLHLTETLTGAAAATCVAVSPLGVQFA